MLEPIYTCIRIVCFQGGATYPNTLHPGAEHTLDRYRYDGEVTLTHLYVWIQNGRLENISILEMCFK